MFDSEEVASNPEKQNLVYQAGSLRIDPMRSQVFCDNKPLELPELSYQLLLNLVSRWPDTVSQEDLIKAVWQNVQVQTSTLGQRVKLLRQSLQDAGCDPKCIALVRAKGYRFAADVTTEYQRPETRRLSHFRRLVGPVVIALSLFTIVAMGYQAWFHHNRTESRQFTDNHVVVLMPFNVDTNAFAIDEYIVKGFNRELANLFKELTDIRVVQPDQRLMTEITDLDPIQIGKGFNAGFLLTGKMKKTADGYLVSVELASTVAGNQGWSEEFNVDADGLYHLKYEIGKKLLAAISPNHQQQFVLRTSPNLLNPQAYDLYLKAMDYHQRHNFQSNIHARRLLKEAYQLSPNCAAVVAGYAEVLHKGLGMGTVDNKMLPFARQLSNEIARIYPTLALGYQLLATNALISDDLELAETLFLRALEADDTEIDALVGLSEIYIGSNQIDKAEQSIRRVQMLAPSSIQALLLAGKLSRLKGNVQEAERVYLSIMRVEPDNTDALAALSNISIEQNEPEQANEYFQMLNNLAPYAPATLKISAVLRRLEKNKHASVY